MGLSEEQIAIIRDHIACSGIRMQSLQEDVLDHLCCVLEAEDNSSLGFEQRLQIAIGELAPDGLADLERKTVYLLNAKKLLYMKKVMHLIGLGSTMSLAMGLCFRLLGWPGGYELMMYGFLTFSLVFLPMTMINRFRHKIQKSLSDRLRFMLGSTSAIVAGLSVLLKILHLPGADFMLLGAAVLFSFGFLPFLFFTNYRKAIQQHL